MADPKKPTSALDLPHLNERARFRSLLLINPNYFGNIANSTLKPVLKIQGDTTYEEIGCVGYEPQLSLLEAVVYVKLATGYEAAHRWA